MNADGKRLVRVCARSDVLLGNMLRIETESELAIVLVNVGGTLTALHDLCSHGAFRLSEGFLEGDRLECALHGAQFCTRTGRNLTPPATEPVAIFPIQVEGEDVLVDYGAR